MHGSALSSQLRALTFCSCCTLLVLYPARAVPVLVLLSNTDPLSGQPLSSDQLVPNLVLRDMIHAWMLQDDADASTSASTSSAAKEVTAAAPEHSTCVVQESPVLPTVECLDSSSCKAGKVACITDCRVGSGSLKDALIPGTPGRASRDV